MNVSKRFRFMFISIAAVVLSVGLALPAMPSYAVTTYVFVNFDNTNFCLGNNSSGQSDVGECFGTPSQTWHVHQTTPIGGTTYKQWENGNNKCLGLAGSTGPQLVIGACSSTSDHSQFWLGPPTGDIYGSITNGHTGQCVGTVGGKINGGTLVIEGACVSGGTQWWLAV